MKLELYGPVNDGFGEVWQVIGPRGAIKAEFYTLSDAIRYIKGAE